MKKKTKNNINYKLMENLVEKYGILISIIAIGIYIVVAIWLLIKKNYAGCLLFVLVALMSIGLTMEMISQSVTPIKKTVNVDELVIFHGGLYYGDTIVNIEKNVDAKLFILRCKEEIVLSKINKEYYFLFKDNE